MTLKDLKPELIFSIFEQITKVPRPSKKEEKIREFLINFAKEHGIEYKTDAIGNVAMFRPASPGCENAPKVLLQGHMDMVCVAEDGVEKDFDNEPIETVIDGEWVRAKGTTLGADNGIGLAAGLAVLIDKSLVTPQVQTLFTVDEETSMGGASNLGAGMIDADILLNLDSEDDGEICVGCAGGIGTNIEMEYEQVAAPADYAFYCFKMSKFQGGHSGTDVNTGRANANKLTGRILWNIMQKYPIALVDVTGGDKHNAIPVKAEATFGVPANDAEAVVAMLNEFAATVKEEYKRTEPDVEFEVVKVDAPAQVMESDAARRFVYALFTTQHGVYSMSCELEGLVETSNNLASVRLGDGKVKVITLQRSAVDSRKYDLANQIEALWVLAGAKVEHADDYPGWAPNMQSKALQVASDIHENLFGFRPKTGAIHAGLECGMFLLLYPKLDMISFGPTLRDVHSPKEAMHIPAVERFWTFLTTILETLAKG